MARQDQSGDDPSGTAYDPDLLRSKYLAERDKRLRADADRQYHAAEGAFAHFTDDPYVEPGFTRAPIAEEIDVLIVGGGFGGLLTAAELVQHDIGSFRIVEQGGDFGGTWYWNRYPGVRCDIESYIYMPLLEEVGTVPSEKYATGAEIFAHCQAIGRHYCLYDRAAFQTKVTSIGWQEADQRWLVETDRGDRFSARFVAVSQGPLARVKLPGIPGIEQFAGKVFHTSRWDYDYTGDGLEKLADRKVAVIGTGATAVQIVPKLAAHAAELIVFQRTPSAIDERNNQATDAAWFASLPRGWQRARMDNFLGIITGQPTHENMVGDRWTDFWLRFGVLMAEKHRTGDPTPPPALMQRVDYAKMEELRARVRATVRNPAAMESLQPWYNYLCKRPLYSDDFLQAFDRPNVTLVDTDGKGVEAIDANGITANGMHHDVDCIIFATGFDVGAPAYKVGGYQVIGRDGLSLAAKWATGISSLHGTQTASFPNFHIIGGTAQGTTAFNFTHILAMQAAHAAEMIGLCLDRGIAAMEVTADAEARWLDTLEAKHVDHQQFYEDCTPGFLNNEGEFKDRPTFVGGTYGGGPFEYQSILAAWREGGFVADVTITPADAPAPTAPSFA